MQKHHPVNRLLRVFAPMAVALGALATAPSAGAAGADVYGVGGGWVTFTGFAPRFFHFAFSAHSGPKGDFGQSEFYTDDELPPLDVSVNVTCVNVVATTPPGAWFAGTVTKVSPQPNFAGIMPGEAIYFDVADGGKGSALTPVDTWLFSAEPFIPPSLCKSSLFTPFSDPDVTQGNIVVKP